MTVIHISFDFPDKIDPRKTKAVKNLIQSQKNTQNIVFSLNRTAVRLNKIKILKDDLGYSFYIVGLPFGVFLFFWMFVAYRRIYNVILKENIKPDLIHAHKLTFEGIIGYLLAKRLKVPYIITVRGNTDIRLLYYKRLYRKLYTRILQNAEKIIFLAPWTERLIQKYIGKHAYHGRYELLPNIVNFHSFDLSNRKNSKTFVIAFHFKTYKTKNIIRIIQAFNTVFDKFPEYSFDIIGDGPNKNIIVAEINKTRHPENFHLKGEIENSKLTALYADYIGYIMPSFPETFGLVYVEALAAGLPVLYSKNAGIDGYFEDFKVGVQVDHRSVSEIASGIESLIVNNEQFKQNVVKMISDGYLNQFKFQAVGDRYSNILSKFNPEQSQA